MKQKAKELLSVEEAMDNLAAIISIDLENPGHIGIDRGRRLVSTEEEFGPDTVQWLSAEGAEPILEILDLTYRAIHGHLIKLYENSKIDLEKSSKGVAAMMTLVGESIEKIETFLNFRLSHPMETPVAERDEFKNLQRFYTQHFVSKFSDKLEGKEAWGEQWGENEESEALDFAKSGLSDFEGLKKDEDYELFYIRNEDQEPFFDREQLKNIKLTCDFDLELEEMEEDPLLKIRAMQDRDLHVSAIQILKDCHPFIADFYKIARKLEDNYLGHFLGMAVIALYLSANPRYLIQNTTGKSCLQYFEDFHLFLRSALKTAEYQKLIAYSEDVNDPHTGILYRLVTELCRSFFERSGGVKGESIGLIHRAMRKGEEIKQKKKEHTFKGETLWNQFSIDDEKYRTLLANFPNGPIFKILDLIRETQDEDIMIPFDPIGQQNLPLKVFEIERGKKKIPVLRLPCPTRQFLIQKAEIIDEFKAYLRSIGEGKGAKKMLLINFQDRASFKEFARSKAIESLSKNAEFSSQLIVITMPKDTDFYHQTNAFLNQNRADEFIHAFKEHLSSLEESGFYLPKQLQTSEMDRFIDMALPAIHEQFFHRKNTLTRRNREDFIEIFYQFFILKCIDVLDPGVVGFSCKDAIDTAAASGASFFGFLKLFTSDFSPKEDSDLLRFLLYTHALFVRERAINPVRLNRTVSMLERFDFQMQDHGKEIFQTFSDFYSKKGFSISHF